MESTTIYVKLLEEGTDVWRPVAALALTDGSFELIGSADQDENEKWEFLPHSRVICAEKIFSDGSKQLVAIQCIANADDTPHR
jgi:hypothetical protein